MPEQIPIWQQTVDSRLKDLTERIQACRACEEHLEPNPVVRLHQKARVLIIGQAPGTRVHATGIPWNDQSGIRLRQWLGLSEDIFYDASQVAIMPMGYCYPGKGKSGDLPPRKECQTLWHNAVFDQLPALQCVLLVGTYAQKSYFPQNRKTLEENLRYWRAKPGSWIPLPHPSPRNTYWLQQRPWFEQEMLPQVRQRLHEVLSIRQPL